MRNTEQMEDLNLTQPARAAEGSGDADGEAFSLETALEQLDQMLEKLSDRETPLEETFLTYQAGMELLKKCEAQVDLIEKKVMVLNGEGGMEELQSGQTPSLR